MVAKSRVVKRIKIPESVLKKAKSAERLNAFWDYIISQVKRDPMKVDVTKVFIGEELTKMLEKCSPYDWLDIGPCVDDDIQRQGDYHIVELRAGWNLATKRRTPCERVRRMLIGE